MVLIHSILKTEEVKEIYQPPGQWKCSSGFLEKWSSSFQDSACIRMKASSLSPLCRLAITLENPSSNPAALLRKGYEYGRSGNPSRAVLEECLALLDDAKNGLAFSSGLAVVIGLCALLKVEITL
uniref:Uncharacterized protein n=1 Tax=Rhodnius prolixus TaxID=13249 RepID=T1I6D1_RHOPR